MILDPILITGVPRSGTSMVAGTVNLCGAFGGIMSGPNPNNAKGMFENSRIREEIVKAHLESIGVDKLGQYPLPDPYSLVIPQDWKDRVITIMKSQGLRDGQPWFYKGAKMCLTWPIWHYAFPDAKWIIVRRRTGDIARSCCKTGFMRAFNNPKNCAAVGAKNEFDGWVWYVNQHEERFIEMIKAGLQVMQVWPERMVNADYKQMFQTIEWLGLKWAEEKVAEFIEPKLWKARDKQNWRRYSGKSVRR